MNMNENAPAVGDTTNQSGSKDLINDPNIIARIGQIFGLLQQANDLIPVEENGCGYTFTMNKIQISLDYHYMLDGSKTETFLDFNPRHDNILEALEAVVYSLRNIIVMRKAGLICGMY